MVRLGIIGAGIMGERLLRAAQGHASVAVSGVWDPAPAALARLGTLAPAAASAEAVIAGCDCVYVAAPPGSHLVHARAALAAGKALFCEKPLATDVADARAFLAEAASARAAVNFPFASSPSVERLGSWVAGLGQPERLEIEVAFATWPRGWQQDAARWLDAPAEGGFTREVVSHFLFLARRLLGPLSLQSASVQFPQPGRSERRVAAQLQAGAVPVRLTGTVGETDADDSNRFTVTAACGSVRLRDWAFAERLDGAWHGDPDAMPHAQARIVVLQRQMDGVARMTQGEPHGLATLQEAFDVQSMVEAILGSKDVGSKDAGSKDGHGA